MKKFFILFALIVLSVSAQAGENGFSILPQKTTVTVGKQPGMIYPGQLTKGIMPFVICMGQDADFDFTHDEGEEYPSIWSMTMTSPGVLSASKIIDLPFASVSFPIRPFVVEDKNSIYLVQGSKVASYKLSNFEKVEEFDVDASASAISIDGDYAYVTVSYWNNPGYVKKYNLTSKEVVDSIGAGFSPRQTLPYWNGSLAVLTEGNYGQTNSVVTLYDVSGEKAVVITEIPVGGLGNSMIMEGNYLYVTMNGTHEIKIINLNSRAIENTITLPTTGGDGPRETLILNKTASDNYQDFEFFTTAYNGRTYYGKGLNVLDSSEAGSKREALTMIMGNVLAVTDMNNFDYSPAYTVSFYYGTPSSVENNKVNYANSYPCPAIDNVTINLYANQAQDATVAIYSVNGTKATEFNTQINDGKINLSATQLNLVSGKYIANVTIGDKTYTANIIINR